MVHEHGRGSGRLEENPPYLRISHRMVLSPSLQQWRHCFAQPAGPDLRAKLLHIVLVQVRPATIAARLHGWDAGLRQERRVIASDIIEGWVIGESSRRSIIAA